MSFSLVFKVSGGKIDPDSVSATGAPDGTYSINGHVHHIGQDAAPSIGVTTPIGGCSSYLSDASIVQPEA